MKKKIKLNFLFAIKCMVKKNRSTANCEMQAQKDEHLERQPVPLQIQPTQRQQLLRRIRALIQQTVTVHSQPLHQIVFFQMVSKTTSFYKQTHQYTLI